MADCLHMCRTELVRIGYWQAFITERVRSYIFELVESNIKNSKNANSSLVMMPFTLQSSHQPLKASQRLSLVWLASSHSFSLLQQQPCWSLYCLSLPIYHYDFKNRTNLEQNWKEKIQKPQHCIVFATVSKYYKWDLNLEKRWHNNISALRYRLSLW